jgi:hypothetical protein
MERHPQATGAVAAGVLCAGGLVAWAALRRRPNPEQEERERRAQLVRGGRIIDGTILEVAGEERGEPASDVRFVLYQYEIGGVAYECSQDVSGLRDRVKAEDLRAGFPCSVRYDIRRPENSIVVAENWSGLRLTALSVPPRRNAQTPPTSAPAAP